MSRCVEDKRRIQSFERRECSAKVKDNYIGSLTDTNSNLKKTATCHLQLFGKNNIFKISNNVILFVYRDITETDFKVGQTVSLS